MSLIPDQESLSIRFWIVVVDIKVANATFLIVTKLFPIIVRVTLFDRSTLSWQHITRCQNVRDTGMTTKGSDVGHDTKRRRRRRECSVANHNNEQLTKGFCQADVQKRGFVLDWNSSHALHPKLGNKVQS